MFLALVKSSRITTTDAKAKELRRFADRMVTLGKKGELAAKRRAFSYLQSHQAVQKLFDEIAPRYKDRAGGYTRVVKFGFRRGDAAQLSIIEFTGLEEKAPRGSVLGARRKASTNTPAISTPPPAPDRQHIKVPKARASRGPFSLVIQK